MALKNLKHWGRWEWRAPWLVLGLLGAVRYEPMAATLDAFDREDQYDETELLLCVQDCGRWPLGETSTRVESYDPGLDWYPCCRELQRHLKDQDRIFQPVFLRLGQWCAQLPCVARMPRQGCYPRPFGTAVIAPPPHCCRLPHQGRGQQAPCAASLPRQGKRQ